MNGSRQPLGFFPFLLLLLLPAAGRCQDLDEVSFVYPRDAEYLLLAARMTRTMDACGEVSKEIKAYRVFGDGRIEIDPLPDWLQEEELVLEPGLVEHLLQSVDAIQDLGGSYLEGSGEEEVVPDSYVEVHLDRLVSPEHAIYYLDVRVAGFREVYDDLAALERFLIHRAASRIGRAMWTSGNPWPPACQEDHRRRHGHRVLEPGWCAPPAFRKYAPGGPFSGDVDRRAEIREKLRERLRTLPRGLPATSPSPSPDGDGYCFHGHGFEPGYKSRDP